MVAFTEAGNTGRGKCLQVWGKIKNSDLHILGVRFLLDIQAELSHITLSVCVCVRVHAHVFRAKVRTTNMLLGTIYA